MQVQGVAIRSCAACRKQHKKCDRKLPACSLCTQRKKECDYDTKTAKRGPKGDSEIYRPYPEITVRSNRMHLIPNEIIDDSNIFDEFKDSMVEFIALDIPALPQEQLLLTVDYIEQGQTHRCPVEHLLLVYSLMAYTFRNWGKEEIAKSVFQKARTLASENFESVMNNINIATSYLFLGMYCVIEDLIDKARFYFGSVWSFLQTNANPIEDMNWKHASSLSYAHFRFLEQLYYQSSAMLYPTLDLTLALKGSIMKMHNLHRYYKSRLEHTPSPVNQPLSAIVLADTGVTDYEEAERAKADMNENTQIVTVDLVDRVHGRISSVLDRLSGILSENDIQARRVQNMLFYQGVKLQVLADAGDEVGVRRTADIISSLTNVRGFDRLSSMVGYVLVYAGTMHAHLLQKSNDPWDQSLLLDRLRLDYLSICGLANKSKYVSKLYAPSLQHIDGILRGVTEQQIQRVIEFPEPTLAIQDTQALEILDDIDQFLAEFE